MGTDNSQSDLAIADQWRGLISSDPDILLGKPCITGTRISVELILQKLGAGETIDELLLDYPHINRQQIKAAIAYALSSVRLDRVYPLPKVGA